MSLASTSQDCALAAAHMPSESCRRGVTRKDQEGPGATWQGWARSWARPLHGPRLLGALFWPSPSSQPARPKLPDAYSYSSFPFFCVKEPCSVNVGIFYTAGFQVFITFEFHLDSAPCPSPFVSVPWAEAGTGVSAGWASALGERAKVNFGWRGHLGPQEGLEI